MKALFIAFSMYSKIPVPQVEWTKKNMRYAMCWFPLIGALIGAILILASWLMDEMGFGSIFQAALFTVIPVLINGGIHLDGFLDTVDARSSYGDREKKLEILKDPHAGAFAIIGCCVYFMVTFAFWSEIPKEAMLLMGFVFVFSRALSGLSVVCLKPAKGSGLLATFSGNAEKRPVRLVMCLYLAVCAGMMLFLRQVSGLACILTGSLVFLYYRHVSGKEFGGITGDLAGFYVQLAELFMLAAVVIVEKII